MCRVQCIHAKLRRLDFAQEHVACDDCAQNVDVVWNSFPRDEAAVWKLLTSAIIFVYLHRGKINRVFDF